MAHEPRPGGFLQPAGSEANQPILPRPRASPLRPGGQKRSGLIDYVDNKLLHISRRYEKRCNPGSSIDGIEHEEARGYSSFAQMATDLEAVIDVVWTSATPFLQNPYLLTIALTSCTSLPSFPFSPGATFHLLKKLDIAFCSLLRGVCVETGQPLPGFEGGRGKLSTTEKVRLRGIVERTRVAIVEVAGKNGDVTEVSSAIDMACDMTTDQEDDDMAVDGSETEGYHVGWEMEIGRVYENTIEELVISLQRSDSVGLE